MGKFERIMQMMSKMSDEEKVKAIETKKGICVCDSCPTYNDCANEKEELLYCALDKSPSCISDEAGCICPSCPLTEQMGLTHDYFCTKGSEKVQQGI